MNPECRRCGYHAMGPEERASTLDETTVERWRCGLCGTTQSFVIRSANLRFGKRDDTSRIVVARWQGINHWMTV